MNAKDIINRIGNLIEQPKTLEEKMQGSVYLASGSTIGHAGASFTGGSLLQFAGFSLNLSRSMQASSLGGGLVYGIGRMVYSNSSSNSSIPTPLIVAASIFAYLGHIPVGCAFVDPSSIVSCSAETAASLLPVFVAGAIGTGITLYKSGFFNRTNAVSAATIPAPVNAQETSVSQPKLA